MGKVILLFLLSLFLEGVTVLILKYFRFSFPNTAISSSGIVGYAQYTGYPFYFDTVVFFIFLSIPIIVLLMYKFWKKRFAR